MQYIGKPAPIFRAPALVDGQFTYLGSMQFIGRWIAVCFLPYVGIVKPDFLDHHAAHLDQINTTHLIVSSGTRPLHRIWLDCPTTLNAPLLYGPLSRLHHTFRVALTQTPVRCQTFLINRVGLLRFHLIHDLTDYGLCALQEIVTLGQSQDTDGVAATDTIMDAREEVMNS